MESNLIERITFNKEICNGKPTIRNMRFTVSHLLELLASGMKENEILDDYDDTLCFGKYRQYDFTGIKT